MRTVGTSTFLPLNFCQKINVLVWFNPDSSLLTIAIWAGTFVCLLGRRLGSFDVASMQNTSLPWRRPTAAEGSRVSPASFRDAAARVSPTASHPSSSLCFCFSRSFSEPKLLLHISLDEIYILLPIRSFEVVHRSLWHFNRNASSRVWGTVSVCVWVFCVINSYGLGSWCNSCRPEPALNSKGRAVSLAAPQPQK